MGHGPIVMTYGNRTKSLKFVDELPDASGTFTVPDNPEFVSQHAGGCALFPAFFLVVLIDDNPGNLLTPEAHGIYNRVGTGSHQAILQGRISSPGYDVLLVIQFPGSQGDIHIGDIITDAEYRSSCFIDSGIKENRITGGISLENAVPQTFCFIDMVLKRVDNHEIDS